MSIAKKVGEILNSDSCYYSIVGRDQELRILSDFIRKGRTRRIFILTGEGGIGKTTLLNQLANGLSQDVNIGWIAQAEARELDAAWKFARVIAKSASDLDTISEEDMATLDQPSPTRTADYEGKPTAIVNVSNISEGSTVNAANNITYIINDAQRADPEEDRIQKRERLFCDVSRFTRNKSCQGRTMLFLIDTLETAQEGFSDALNTFFQRIGPVNLALILAGRSAPCSFPINATARILNDLLPSEADTLLCIKGAELQSSLASDGNLRNSVIDRLGGHPEFLTIAAKVIARDPSMTAADFRNTGVDLARDELVTQFLLPRHVLRIANDLDIATNLNQKNTEELLVWLGEVALPRWFDQSTVNALGHNELFAVLNGARDDLVRPLKVGNRHVLQFTDRIADMLRSALHRIAPTRVKTAHALLANWAIQEIERSEPTVFLILAHQYHLFLAEPTQAQPYFERIFRLGSDAHDIDLCRVLLENIADIPIPWSRTALWIQLRHADYYRLKRDYKRAEPLYLSAIRTMKDNQDFDIELLCSLLNNLGIVRVFQSGDTLTIKRGIRNLNDSLEIAKRNRRPWFRALALCVLGVAHGNMANLKKKSASRETHRQSSIDCYRKSAEVCRRQILRLQHLQSNNNTVNKTTSAKDAAFWIKRYILTHGKCLQNLGSQYQILGRSKLAAQMYEKALEKYYQIGNRYGMVGSLNMIAKVQPEKISNQYLLDNFSARVYQANGDVDREALHVSNLSEHVCNEGRFDEWAKLGAHAIELSLRWGAHDLNVHVAIVRKAILYIINKSFSSKDSAPDGQHVYDMTSMLMDELDSRGVLEIAPGVAKVLQRTKNAISSASKNDSTKDILQQISNTKSV